MRVLQLELTLELGIDDYVPHRCSHSKELRAVTRFWSCLAHGLSGRNFEVFSSQHQRRFTAKLTDRIPRSSTSEFCPIVTKFCDSVPSPRSSFLSSRSSVTSSCFHPSDLSSFHPSDLSSFHPSDLSSFHPSDLSSSDL